MHPVLDFLPMMIHQQLGPQTLQRQPEPSNVTDGAENVAQYDQVMGTKLAVGYAAALEAVYRARPEKGLETAVDLACGPGHYTVCLARYLDCREVTGIDLSEPMIRTATANAAEMGLEDQVQFRVGDVTRLEDLEGGSLDLVSFTGAAHHMPNLETVSDILGEMDRIASPDGLVMVMDLARLRTAELTERYVDVLGKDYVDRSLSDFLEDFRNSMYAVWTPAEFRQAIPRSSARWWCHLVPRGLPMVQMIFGLPVGRKRLFVRSGFPAREHPLIREWYPRWQEKIGPDWARDSLKDWKLMRMAISLASKRMFPPARQ